MSTVVSLPQIIVRNMTLYQKGQKQNVLLRDINLSIPTGASVCIKGEIGSGKTSLLNVLGLLDKPDSGELLLGDKKTNFTQLSRAELDSFINQYYAYVFQTTELMMHWTALENVALSIIARGYSKSQSHIEAQKYCNYLGLSKAEVTREVSQLSGGQKQLVGIARALAKNPKILIADEPTAHLDQKRKKEISSQLIRNAKKQNMTVIVATHDNLEKHLFDKIYVIKNKTLELTKGK